MGTQTGSLDGASGSSAIGGAKVKVVVVAPPGLRPEAITLKVIDTIRRVTALARPGPELLVLLADLKRAGGVKRRSRKPWREQSMRALSQPRPSETEATRIISRARSLRSCFCRSTRPAMRTAFQQIRIWSVHPSATPRRCSTILFSAAGCRDECDHRRARQAGHDCRCIRAPF